MQNIATTPHDSEDEVTNPRARNVELTAIGRYSSLAERLRRSVLGQILVALPGKMVEPRGIEPLTFALRTRRSPI